MPRKLAYRLGWWLIRFSRTRSHPTVETEAKTVAGHTEYTWRLN